MVVCVAVTTSDDTDIAVAGVVTMLRGLAPAHGVVKHRWQEVHVDRNSLIWEWKSGGVEVCKSGRVEDGRVEGNGN